VPRPADLALVALGLALCLGIFLEARHYPDVPWPLGGPPGFFPILLAVVLALLLAAVLVESLAGGGAGEAISARGAIRVAIAVAGLALVPLAMRLLGFHLTGFLVALGVMLLVHGREGLTPLRLLVMVVIAALATALLHVVFQDLAGRRLPAGRLLR
jgi:hypothetical protein